jgi:hypothetical protein
MTVVEWVLNARILAAAKEYRRQREIRRALAFNSNKRLTRTSRAQTRQRVARRGAEDRPPLHDSGPHAVASAGTLANSPPIPSA